MKATFWSAWTLLCVCHAARSAEILAVLTIPSHDDQFFFSTLTLELARRGHRLVVITPDPGFHRSVNASAYDVIDTGHIYNSADAFAIKDMSDILIDNSLGVFLYSQNALASFEVQMNEPRVKALVSDRTRRFDLIIADGFIPVAFAFSEYYKAPFVNLVSHHNLISTYESIGNPSHPLLYRDAVAARRPTNVVTRLVAAYSHYSSQMLLDSVTNQCNSLAEQYLNVTRPLQEIAKEAAMTLVNGHHLTAGPRPIVPTLKFVGGMHLRPPSPLPEDTQKFIDNSKSNIIYVNLGQDPTESFFSMETRKGFIEAFEDLKYKFIWLWTNDDIPQHAKKTHFITNRHLQQDILGSDKVKLFITQGDESSIEEAIYHEVPMLVIASKFGYMSQANYVVTNKIGNQTLPIAEFIMEAIHEVRGDRLYKRQIRLLKQQIFDQPWTALERAVFWTEYVLRHNGTAHLRVASLPFYQYFYIDIIVFGVVASILGAYLTYRITRFWIRFWWRTRLIVFKLGRLMIFLILFTKNVILRFYRLCVRLYKSKRTTIAAVPKKEKTN